MVERTSSDKPAAMLADGSDEPNSGVRASSPEPGVGGPEVRHEITSVHEIAPDSINRRSAERVPVTWSVDCETEDTFLYASITNISEMGIFVRTTDPLPVGTRLKLRFAPPDASEAFVLDGVVQWINQLRPLSDNPNPGMGIRFENLRPEDRERIVDTIRTIAYLRSSPN